MSYVRQDDSIISINGNSKTAELYHEINGSEVKIKCLGSDFVYPFALLQGSEFTLKLPFCNEVKATLRLFESKSEIDKVAEVTLTFELSL